MTDNEYEIPNDENVSADDIEPGADLSGADLSEASLPSADLSGANLSRADLSDAALGDAKLSETNLRFSNLSGAGLVDIVATDSKMHQANFSKATLEQADLSGTNLTAANLKEANLLGADISKANLAGADFSGADLTDSNMSDSLFWNTTLSNALLSRNTSISSQEEIFERVSNKEIVEQLSDPVYDWDAIARANHEIKTAYSDNGLLGRARKARVRERRARRKEAKAEDGWPGTAAWAGSLASRFVTGYGVQIWPVALLMLLLWVGSAAVYTLHGGIAWVDSLYFSVVTFTTSPPAEPALSGISRFVAGVETFLGTTAIVFLGYVLGTRERV